MGYRQHLVRSILAIREQGGVLLADGSRVQVEPMLVGRSEAKLAELAAQHGIERLHRPTSTRRSPTRAGRSTPTSSSPRRAPRRSARRSRPARRSTPRSRPPRAFDGGPRARRASPRAAGIKNGVVHDKLYLPGLQKLKRLIDSGFFGRILSVRGEFGYWVFEGDWQPAQRPSWNYRAEDGGGIVVDMFPHWNYVLENLFGRVE